jgi:hypothetical protein
MTGFQLHRARSFDSPRPRPIFTPMPVPTARPPVVILGMHRSGTSMVSELLDELGLFVGKQLQDDHESTYFLDLNEQLFARVGASWDRPLPVLDFLACDEALRMTVDALTADLSSRRIRPFLGQRTSLAAYDKPWGWKDPRTILTLPLWLRLFPGARLVYIIRNGVDVAKSLMVRERQLLATRVERFDTRMRKHSLRSYLDRAGYKGSPRCLNLRGGFDLWAEYVAAAERHLAGVAEPVYRVRFEDVLREPMRHLPELARFCGLDDGSDRIAAAAKRIDGTRAMAFATDPATAAFYQQVRSDPWMVKYGYDNV